MSRDIVYKMDPYMDGAHEIILSASDEDYSTLKIYMVSCNGYVI